MSSPGDCRPKTATHSRLFAVSFGAFLGVTLLKFGNPPILEKWVTAPSNVFEFLLGYPWPIAWAYGLLGVVAALGLMTAHWRIGVPRWLCAIPLVWLLWELLAATQTVAPGLSRPTVVHFVACMVCFYLGFFSLSRIPTIGGFWLGLLVGFLLV